MPELGGNATLAERVTGSTDSPIADGSTRGMIWLLLTGIVNFLAIEVVEISVEGLGALNTIIIALSYILGGAFDAFIKPKIRSNL